VIVQTTDHIFGWTLYCAVRPHYTALKHVDRMLFMARLTTVVRYITVSSRYIGMGPCRGGALRITTELQHGRVLYNPTRPDLPLSLTWCPIRVGLAVFQGSCHQQQFRDAIPSVSYPSVKVHYIGTRNVQLMHCQEFLSFSCICWISCLFVVTFLHA